MKYLFKVILLFLIIFNFLVPTVHYSANVAVIIAGLYYLFVKKSLPLTYFFSKYCIIILAGTLFIALSELAVIALHDYVGGGFYTRYLVQGYMLLCMVFVLPILIDKEETAYNEAITVICGAFALQGLIHTLAYMIPSFGTYVLNFQSADPVRVQAAEAGMQNFRFYSLTGAPFFDLPAAYSLAFILFFRLQLVPDQNYLRGWKAFAVMLFMLMGTALSGRTGFIGLGLGLLLYFFYRWNKLTSLWRNVIKIAGGFLCLLVVFYALLTPAQQKKITDSVFPFAFEAYYNWRDTGRFATGSSDALMEVHYYPIDAKTVLWGRGGKSRDFRDEYVPTDAGYMEHIFIGGIFYLLMLIVYQWLFFREPVRMAKQQHSDEGNTDYLFFLLLFIHMFILEYKGGALGTIHLIEVLLLYIGVSYLTEQYALEDVKYSKKETLQEPAFA